MYSFLSLIQSPDLSLIRCYDYLRKSVAKYVPECLQSSNLINQEPSDFMDKTTILGRKSNEKPLDPAYFKVSGRLTKLLGADSVSDRFVAINELVKNAYDADSTKVVIKFENLRAGSPMITITDDGHGMEYYDIDNSWLVIGTDSKVRDPYTKKFKRRKIGHKGIGRFAIQNLARMAEIVSYPEGQDTGYRVVFDWASYETGNVMVNTVPNQVFSFSKPKSKKGFEIRLHDLRHKWDENSIKELSRNLSMIIPPNMTKTKFTPIIETREFPRYSGKLKSDILKNAVFTFKGSLQNDGTVKYALTSPRYGKKNYSEYMGLTCGPVEFIFFFYYRDKERMKESGIKISDIESLKTILDEFGGIKLYRNNVRVTGFGEPGSDWLQLDSMRVQDTAIPGNNQIIGFVKITAEHNPLIVDTTTREGIIGGQAFEDLKAFVRASVKFFSDRRKELEGKRGKKKPVSKKELKKITASLAKTEPTKLIDFRPRYPEVFYKPLEEEINSAFEKQLPNATLVLARKLVENLLYNILEYKFPRDVDLWYNTSKRRAHDFGILVEHLENKMHKFSIDQVEIIKSLISLIKPFKREANTKTHKVLEYLEEVDELKRLKIPEIIELELKIIEKVRGIQPP
ncbi:MAG: ATP-binding protein [Nitrososphaera sp.]